MPAVAAPKRLIEQCTAGDLRVDIEAGVIRDCKLLGQVSLNGREYTEVAMADAARLFENASVMFDHDFDGRGRKVMEQIGWLENIRQVGDGIRGDFHVLKQHPSSGLVFEYAQRNPRRIGFSQTVSAVTRQEGRTEIVEQILSVESVDLVTNPATTRGLFESLDQPQTEEQETPMVLARDVVLKTPTKTEGRSRLLEMVGMDEMGIEMEEPSATSDPKERLRAALRAAVMAILDGEGTMDEIIEKIKTLVGMSQGNGETVTEADEPPAIDVEKKAAEVLAAGEMEPAKVTESLLLKRLEATEKQLKEQTDLRRKQEEQIAIRGLFEAVDVKPTADDLRICAGLSKPDRQLYVTQRRQLHEASLGAAPRDAGGQGSEANEMAYPTDGSHFAKALRQ